MAALNDWNAEKMLDQYIYDYLVKKNRPVAAQALMQEANLANEPIAINAPEGFLLEWWSVFWDIFIAKTTGKSSPAVAAYIKEQNSKARQQQHSHSMHQSGQVQRGHVNYSALNGPMVPLSSNGRGAKMQVVQGTCGQQILAQTQNPTDINGQLGVAQRSLHDPSLIYGQGFNQGDDALPLNGLPTMMAHSKQQLQERLQQQQQNTRKWKQPATSRAANNTDTGNTIGPSNSLPSTPSTHTPGDCIAVAGNVHHLNNSQKSPLMYEFNGTGGLASPANQMDVPGHMDFSVDSYFSKDRDEIHADENEEFSKSFGLTEVSRIHTSNKVGCVHFSSDGKFLANAGHEKKVVLWNMDTAQTTSSLEEHSQIITDICFRPNSTQLVTSSFDRTVRLWDANELSMSKYTFIGHESYVTSLDFHSKKMDLLCSCDRSGEIRFWNVDQCSHMSTSKGASGKLRFHPRIGELMAASAENMVSVFDFETNMKKLSYQGHEKVVQSLCWDSNGDYLASLCQDYVKVWSLTSGECIHEWRSRGNKFKSCVFHPSCPGVMVIGGYQTFDLWDMAQNKKMTMPAHDDMVAALAQSSVCGMIASASHDKSVKIWKSEC